ncbi:MAG TPA: glycosyl hydrolase family 18 protein [Pelobium sp.]|nr:glycosyl hydrolase family 18 protein [Pelobium sp.]
MMSRLKDIAILLVFILIVMPFFCLASCKSITKDLPNVAKEKFRIIGYFRGDLVKDISKVNFSALTHINIAFANPDSTGSFSAISGLKEFVIKAHKNNTKVLISLGGGKAPEYYANLISPTKRIKFIEEINKLADSYRLDGIDVDLEGKLITQDYEGFINDLSNSLKADILLTAAVATEYGKTLPIKALEKLDFVNIMSYDKTGPWRPSKPGQHSPYEMAVTDVEYWHTVKGVPKEKLNLGLPFYAYSFNGDKSGSYTYNRIVTDYPGAEYKDEIEMKDGSIAYYNGISTIRKKTALALNEAGGVMIWQILQDADRDQSLLSLIKDIADTAQANSQSK